MYWACKKGRVDLVQDHMKNQQLDVNYEDTLDKVPRQGKFLNQSFVRVVKRTILFVIIVERGKPFQENDFKTMFNLFVLKYVEICF